MSVFYFYTIYCLSLQPSESWKSKKESMAAFHSSWQFYIQHTKQVLLLFILFIIII